MGKKKSSEGFENLVLISTFTELYRKKYRKSISTQAIRDKIQAGMLSAVMIDGYTFLDKSQLDEKQ